MTVEPGPVKAYIACSWFTPEQREQLDAGVKAIEANPTVSREFSHFPLDHQYKGMMLTNTRNLFMILNGKTGLMFQTLKA